MNKSEIYNNIYNQIHEEIYQINLVKKQPKEWIESNIILPDGVSRYRGPFSYDISPYVKEIVNHLSSESPARVVAIMKCAQIGLTQGLIIPGMAYIISEDPAPMMFMAGDKELAKTSIQERFDPIIQSSGLTGLIRPSVIKSRNQRTGNTDFSKEYAGGRLTVEGTNNVTKMRQISVKFIFADDWEAAPRNDKNEGSLRSLIEGRQTSYGNMAKTFFISTPTIKQTSNIEPVYELGDQRKWHWECPSCLENITPEWRVKMKDGTDAGIIYELNSNNQLINSSVRYRCQNCGHEINEKEKYNLNLKGKWIPTAETQIENYYSYHLNALVIPPGFVTWIDLVKQWLEAVPPGQPVKSGQLQTFINIRLGQTWEEKGESPKANQLQENVNNYKVGLIPDLTCQEQGNGKIVLLTISCDLNGKMEQGNEDVRLDWELVAHTSSGQQYNIEHGSIGTFQRVRTLNKEQLKKDLEREKYTYAHGQYNSVWNDFEEIIRNEFECESGKKLTVNLTVIDTGYFTHNAMKFVQKFDDILVVGIKGKIDENYRKISKDTPFISRSRETKDLYLVEVNQVKDILSERIKLKPSFDGSQPEGYINFPVPEFENNKYTYKNYFAHYEGEKRIEAIKFGETIGYSWQKKNSDSINHFWDIAVYNIAAREIFLDILKRTDRNLAQMTWVDFCSYVLD